MNESKFIFSPGLSATLDETKCLGRKLITKKVWSFSTWIDQYSKTKDFKWILSSVIFVCDFVIISGTFWRWVHPVWSGGEPKLWPVAFHARGEDLCSLLLHGELHSALQIWNPPSWRCFTLVVPSYSCSPVVWLKTVKMAQAWEDFWWKMWKLKHPGPTDWYASHSLVPVFRLPEHFLSLAWPLTEMHLL